MLAGMLPLPGSQVARPWPPPPCLTTPTDRKWERSSHLQGSLSVFLSVSWEGIVDCRWRVTIGHNMHMNHTDAKQRSKSLSCVRDAMRSQGEAFPEWHMLPGTAGTKGSRGTPWEGVEEGTPVTWLPTSWKIPSSRTSDVRRKLRRSRLRNNVRLDAGPRKLARGAERCQPGPA